MFKNVAGQKLYVFAFDKTTNGAKTGDAANITANLRLDGGAANAVDDTNPTELEDGYYYFDITQAESNADYILMCPASSTANIQVIGCPAAVFTRPPYFNALGIESDGDLTKVNALNGHIAQTGDGYAILNDGTYGNAALETLVDEVESILKSATYGLSVIETLVDELESRLTAGRATKLDNLDTTVSSRSSHSAAAVWAVGTRTLTSFGTLVTDIWHHLLAGITTAGSIGKLIKDYLDAAISSRSSHGEPDLSNLDATVSSRSSHNAAAVKTAMEADGSKLDHLWETTEDDVGVRRFTENALEQAPSGTGGDATEAKQDAIIASLIESKGTGFVEATHSNVAIINTGNADWVTGGDGGGSETVTITVNDGTDPVPDVTVEIWNSDLTAFVTKKITDSNGKVIRYLDDGNYKVIPRKAGYSFDVEDLTVSGTTEKTYSGTYISPGTPPAADTCRVTAYCFNLDGKTPLSSAEGKVKIVSLPFHYNGMYFTGDVLVGTYDSTKGELIWDLPWGATILFSVPVIGVNKQALIPSVVGKLLRDLS